MTSSSNQQGSVDFRTRPVGGERLPVDPQQFWREDWPAALARNGERAAADAARLQLSPFTLVADGFAVTLSVRDGELHAEPGESSELCVAVDGPAFTDWVGDRKSAMGLLVGNRARGNGKSCALFCAWDPVVRCALDGRGVYRPGEIQLQAVDGSPLDLEQSFTLEDDRDAAAHFLAEAGFVLLKDFLDEAMLAQLDADLARSVDAAQPDDGEAWWASTGKGEQYPCRILNFSRKSAAFLSMVEDAHYRAIGGLLPDGHVPGDSFGEHFGDISAEGLVKRVDSVAGLSCLPWHKDCERGGHSLFCAGIVIGVCLTPIDEAHGGLEILAGSHRANVTREQVQAGIDLPAAVLRADRGDVTVHLSCAFHRSTHPASAERRVIYTGFTLPPLPGDDRGSIDRDALEEERSLIGDKTPPPELQGPGA